MEIVVRLAPLRAIGRGGPESGGVSIGAELGPLK
jgi:hypothetical protein